MHVQSVLVSLFMFSLTQGSRTTSLYTNPQTLPLGHLFHFVLFFVLRWRYFPHD